MISRRQDYGYLLDDLQDISKKYYINYQGEVINQDGEVQDDPSIIDTTKFYISYCMAYKALDTDDKKSTQVIDKNFVDRALTTYGMFNYFINTCIGEYRMYDDIGTGNVTYVPYQQLASFFFENEAKKEILMNYLKTKFNDILTSENTKNRVK